MGERRKEGSRGSADRDDARSGAGRRDARKTSRPRSSGGQVIYLHAGRRVRRGATGASTRRSSSTGDTTGSSTGRGRLRMVVVAFALVGVLLGARAAQMILVDDGRYEAFASERGAAGATSAAQEPRGSIISADGRQLATTLQADRIVATPYQIEHPDEAARTLAGVLGPETGLKAQDIEASLTKRGADGHLGGYSVVADGVKPETAQKVVDLGIDGLSLEPVSVRVYPEKALASQLIGHVNAYGDAYGGIEESYNESLQRGQDVHLTLDTAVQQELEKALEATVQKNEAKGAVGLVMRADDGAIVALANMPDYDNNQAGQATLDAQRDRVLTDPYEPGSTFKAFTVSSAIQQGAVTTDTTFVIPDHITVADRVIHDSEPHETEIMTPQDVLEKSSNVGAIQIGERLGGQKLYEYIRRFGFGQKTGVDVRGEDPGSVPDYADWSGSTIGNIPMGQGLTVTPLQLTAGYATIADGGLRVTPHVTEQGSPPDPGPRVISEETSAIVRGMLQGVVDEGSGHFAQIPGYTVAGKTGTSQVVDPATGTYGDEYVASFIGFAPATHPKYVALIAVNDPQRTYWGEIAAAPPFRKVMSFALSYFNVPPDRPTTQEVSP